MINLEKQSTARLSALDLEVVRIARGHTQKTQKQIIAESLKLWIDLHQELHCYIPSKYWSKIVLDESEDN